MRNGYGSMTHSRLASGMIILLLMATTGWTSCRPEPMAPAALLAAALIQVDVPSRPAALNLVDRPPSQASDACALVTPAEAATIMGTASRPPRTGAFTPTVCAIESEKDPAKIYINTGFETDAILQTRGLDGARQAFDGTKNSVDDEEALPGVGDAAFFSKKINGLYILKAVASRIK